MESTHPVEYCRLVVSGSKDPVEYFVRAKGDGRAVVPAQTETRTGWLMCPATLRARLRHWMRAEQVSLRCLLASRPTRWPLLKGIQEHLSSEGVSAVWSAHCSVRSIGLFLCWEDGLLHFLDPCGGGSWGNMPTASVLVHRVLVAALRRRHSSPLQDESDVLLSLASNERSSFYAVQAFLQDNEFVNGYEGCVAAEFECRFCFFLRVGIEELQVLAYFIAGVRAGVSATRSAAFGKACFTLAAGAGIDESNVRAHHPTFCTVLPRRQDLIASHIEPSPCGRNVASKRSRGRRARHLHSFVEVSRGRKCEPFGI
ncbi:hypothetical protein C3747_425g6 [Trypanosoma cruzi]|uniref:Uncharacterized protein n=1 Tax=Trypanosoma cruzi TaxID=5693 RepID=A0A2V2UWP9_TRYCR|nr:hypothetical protein C3747_425g6 [Trypanosoma cruzi]